MQYSFHGLTDAGSVRTNNEDSLAIDAAYGVAILADGMGGYNAGEVASAMATDFIKAELVRRLSVQGRTTDLKQIAQVMALCVEDANVSILRAAIGNPRYNGMGTTLVVGVFQGNHLVLGHIGDSRCYRLRDGQLMQITRDHSVLQEQIDAGLMSIEQAAVAPGRNLLTRALGVEETTKGEIHEHLVHDADIYLMCSDGLSDMVKDCAIGDILNSNKSLSVKARQLVEQAIANGGRDNVSVVLVQAKALGKGRLNAQHFLM